MRAARPLRALAIVATLSLAVHPASAQIALEYILQQLLLNAAAKASSQGRTPCDDGIPDNSCKAGQIAGVPTQSSDVSISFGTPNPAPLPSAQKVAVWERATSERLVSERLETRYTVYSDQATAALAAAHISSQGTLSEDTIIKGVTTICESTPSELVFSYMTPHENDISRIIRVELFAYSCPTKRFIWADMEYAKVPPVIDDTTARLAAAAWANRVLIAADEQKKASN